MKKASVLSLVLAASAFFVHPTLSYGGGNFPTHCKSDEFAYLNAKMGKVVDNPKEVGGFTVVKNGKILSLCADKANGEASRLYYRYGKIGNIEMERVATPEHRFWSYSRTTSPHTGDNLTFFKSGEHTYYILEATDEGSGVSLEVVKSGKVIVNLFSGNSRGEDYENELIVLPSALFLVKEPPDAI